MLVFVKGDVLEADVTYVAHQCNCTSRGAAGLAREVFRRRPDANTYAIDRKVGTVDAFPPTCNSPGILNCNAQLSPGYPKGEDSAAQRLVWFRQCLSAISAMDDIRSIAFPHFIGCGLAGGDWGEYCRELSEFATRIPSTRVLVCLR